MKDLAYTLVWTFKMSKDLIVAFPILIGLSGIVAAIAVAARVLSHANF